jgi:uncharacterized protein
MTESTPSLDAVVAERVAEELRLDPALVARALSLLAESEPIPYLARYRRDAVGGFDEVTLRDVRAVAHRVREMEQRREFILRALDERGNVPERARRRIERCRDRIELEYLYEPFRPPRKTRASIAREQGLEPLADALLGEGVASPAEAALPFVSAEKGVPDVAAALAGAREILAERFAVDPEVRFTALRVVEKDGVLKATPVPGKQAVVKEFEERLGRIPSHRFLAVRRAEKEGALSTRIEFADDKIIASVAHRHFPKEPSAETRAFLESAAHEAVRVLRHAVVDDALRGAKERADDEAIAVFSNNLRDLLLAPPAGPRRVLGVDPAPRGAIAVACVDDRGNHLENARIRPFDKDETRRKEAFETLLRLCSAHSIEMIALGNGAGRHEVETFLHEALAPLGDAAPPVAVVNEVGAGTYAGGPVGRSELPSLPVPVRAAVSLARRLIDPVAELVKVDPRQIGVGQYQNDVDPERLGRALDEVVEHCVNQVGVDVNRAPVQLLANICGFSTSTALAIVKHREQAGPYRSRAAIASVPGVSPTAFRRGAGFLRIRGGEDPIDATGVHPDDGPVVQRIAAALGTDTAALIGNADLLNNVVTEDLANETHSPAAVAGTLSELLEGGRDPRPPLEIVSRPSGVKSAEDLKPGMALPGRVTNVTNFGAFVDIGLRQDGLVHVSELADRFVRDPTTVVRVGQMVQIRVLCVDPETGRISLSMKSGRPVERERGPRRDRDRERGPRRPRRDGRDRPRRDEQGEAEERAIREAPSPREPEPAPQSAPESANPVPGGMSEEEFMKKKLEELRRRFS